MEGPSKALPLPSSRNIKKKRFKGLMLLLTLELLPNMKILPAASCPQYNFPKKMSLKTAWLFFSNQQPFFHHYECWPDQPKYQTQTREKEIARVEFFQGTNVKVSTLENKTWCSPSAYENKATTKGSFLQSKPALLFH